MEYKLKIKDNVLPLEVDVQTKACFQVKSGDASYCVTHIPISENQIHLNINGRGVNVYVDKGRESKTVVVNGTPYRVQDADLLERSGFKRKGMKEVPREVTPPMPAVVVRVLVNEGDTVEKGEGVVVVSAMKMEATLNAPHSGRVAAIHVTEGDKVAPGQILVDIEK